MYTATAMRRVLFALVLGAAAAGCDDSLDLHLVAPPGETTTRVSYACVSHIEVVAYGDELAETCIEIPDGAIRSLRDHDLGGLLSIELPAELYAIDLRGIRSDGDCRGTGSNTVFHGEAFYAGGWDLDVDLVRGLDCATYSTEPTPIQLLALDKLLGTVVADRCLPPPDAGGYAVRLDHQFPYYETIDFPVNASEPASLDAQVGADGKASITGPHFHGAVAPSCLSAGTSLVPVGEIAVTSCIDPTQATLCGPTGTGEIITITPAMAPVFDQAKLFNDTAVAVGLVWDAATRRPITGATITRLDDIDDLGFRTFDFTAGVLSASTAAATSDAGLFGLEIIAPTTVLVEANGYRARTVVIGALAIESPGITSIPLGR